MSTYDLISPSATVMSRERLAFVGALLVVVVGAAFFNDAGGYHNPDVSWLLVVGDRMLDGEQLYVDVWESNPPFSVLLYWPMAALERLTGIRGEAWVSFSMFAFAGLAVWLADAMLKQARCFTVRERSILALGFLIVGLFLMPQQFAEREHFGAFAMMPLLALYGARASVADFRPTLWVAIGAGVLGAILLIIKSQYALGFALPAAFLLWQRRSLAAAFAPEHIAGVVVCGSYAISVFAFFPEYVERVLPTLMDLYMAYRLPLRLLFNLSLLMFVPAACLATFLMFKTRGRSSFAAVWLLASFGFLVGFFLSGKGWMYHFFPALTAVFGAILFAGLLYSRTHKSVPHMLVIATGALAFVLTPYLDSTHTTSQSSVPVEVLALGDGPRLAVISNDIGVANPRARIMNADWRERDNAEYIAALALNRLPDADPTDADHLRLLVSEAVDRKAAYFAEQPVDVVILDHRLPRLIEAFTSDPRIARALEDFRALEREGEIEFLVRDSSVSAAG